LAGKPPPSPTAFDFGFVAVNRGTTSPIIIIVAFEKAYGRFFIQYMSLANI
jgi:hypothetical protein